MFNYLAQKCPRVLFPLENDVAEPQRRDHWIWKDPVKKTGAALITKGIGSTWFHACRFRAQNDSHHLLHQKRERSMVHVGPSSKISLLIWSFHRCQRVTTLGRR